MFIENLRDLFVQIVCVECLIGKQKKPILFKVTEPSSIPYRTPPACAKRAAYPDPPPVILLPESIAAQAAYQLRYKNTEYYVTVWDSQSDDDVFSSYLFLQKQMYDHLGRLQVNYTGGTGL